MIRTRWPPGRSRHLGPGARSAAELERGNAEACPAAADIAASATAMLDDPGPASAGIDGVGRVGARGWTGLPKVPRWEPAFAAALGEIGLDIPLDDSARARS